MTTRLDIALEALREIEADSRDSVGPGKWYGCGCYTPAEDALRAIDAAPPEITLTREEAELCLRLILASNQSLDSIPHSDIVNAARLTSRIGKELLPLGVAEGETP